MTQSKRSTSQRRWEAGHHLLEKVVPTLPQPTHAQVLTVCWFYAKTTSGNVQEFNAAKKQISNVTNLSERTVQRCLREMETGGVIVTTKAGTGNRGSTRYITGHPFKGKTHSLPMRDKGETL
jgi:hypothetical protein